MSIVGSVFKGARNFMKGGTSSLKKGATGSVWAAGYGLSAAFGSAEYGNKYGTGGGIGIGLAEAAIFDLAFAAGPIGMVSLAAGYGSYYALEKGKEIYKTNRQVNFGAPMVDKFGTMSTMRQRSGSALS
ncbi:MAG: hypothetical protein WBQ32_08840, partial [Ignavibacteriaceae bacterium]